VVEKPFTSLFTSVKINGMGCTWRDVFLHNWGHCHLQASADCEQSLALADEVGQRHGRAGD
jgi:hypothetical protein